MRDAEGLPKSTVLRKLFLGVFAQNFSACVSLFPVTKAASAAASTTSRPRGRSQSEEVTECRGDSMDTEVFACVHFL